MKYFPHNIIFLTVIFFAHNICAAEERDENLDGVFDQIVSTIAVECSKGEGGYLSANLRKKGELCQPVAPVKEVPINRKNLDSSIADEVENVVNRGFLYSLPVIEKE